MTEVQKIVAYLFKGVWYPTEEVESKRASDNNAFVDARSFTVAELRRRKKYGSKVPEWIDLDEPKQG